MQHTAVALKTYLPLQFVNGMFGLQNGAPAEEDLKNWGHHPDVSTVPDEIMQKSAGDDVTFIFSCQVWTRVALRDHC